MIKPLPYKNPSDTEIANKINELIDAVNALQSCLAPVDPYAEQRKWIGRLCKFGDGANNIDDLYTIGILLHVGENSTPFHCDNGLNYRYCEPITADDKLIYKGENDSQILFGCP